MDPDERPHQDDQRHGLSRYWYYNGTARFKNVNNYLNANIYSYLEASGGQSSDLYLYVVHNFNTSVN